uniref:Uncharacterized protein n=1 Tax=Lepeophtheirus salmonis TaxID=72036 RepID=A0A0K2TNW9_LEPSM
MINTITATSSLYESLFFPRSSKGFTNGKATLI